MGKTNQTNKRVPTTKKQKKIFLTVGVVVLLLMGFVVAKLGSGPATIGETPSGDLTILKSDVSDTARFYAYNSDGTNMEVLAVKASDGTIRTALNTCQVCYDSGRGYYKQQGDELICQNCGNRFQLDQIERIKGGCNPVPIMKEDKTEDATSIVISKEFLQANKELFGNWKK